MCLRSRFTGRSRSCAGSVCPFPGKPCPTGFLIPESAGSCRYITHCTKSFLQIRSCMQMKRRSWCCGNRTGFLQQTVCAGDRVFAASAFGGTAICAATAEVRANCRGIFSVGANGIREKSCAKESLWRSAWLCLAAAELADARFLRRTAGAVQQPRRAFGTTVCHWLRTI